MSTKPKSVLLWLATAVFFLAFVAAYEHHTYEQAHHETERYADLLEIHVWNLDFAVTEEYLNIIGKSNSYEHLTLFDQEGQVFVEKSFSDRFWRIDGFLKSVGLQETIQFQVPLNYNNSEIGTFYANMRNRNNYLYLNVLLLLVLIVSVALYLGEIAGHEQEIEERQQVEEALKKSEAKWRSLVDSAPDIILTLDQNLVVTYINRGEGPLTPELLIGQDITKLFPSPNENKGILAFKEVLETGKTVIYEADTPDFTSDAMRYFSARMGPIFEDDKIAAVLVVVTEVSEQKRFAEELRSAKNDAERANRLKTDFLANMSHEIRTPLNVILGYTSLVEKFAREHLPAKRIVYFDYIRNASRRLMDTIQKIVDISRFHIEDFPFTEEAVYVDDVVKDTIHELSILASQKNITLSCDIEHSQNWTSFDRYAITQSITNVVENAIKYTENGGFVSVHLFRQDDSVLLEIKDTGIGIGETYLPYIFDEFSQEEGGYSRSFEGTGLGLALVKKFQNQGGGTITVNSAKGKGTTVLLAWPRIEPPKPDPDPKTILTASTQQEKFQTSHSHIILVVEDDPSTQSFMQTALGEDYDIRLAANQSEVDDIVAHSKPDLILMDLSLKEGESGIELTRQLRSRPEMKGVPIIALTAHAMDADKDNALWAGCNDYLSKPCPLDKLLNTVAKHIKEANP